MGYALPERWIIVFRCHRTIFRVISERSGGAAMSEKPSKVECAGGCGKFQMVRKSKIEKRWTYIGCGICEGWERLEEQLRSTREGMVTEHDYQVAGGFRGLRVRIATQEERASIARARAIAAAALTPEMAQELRREQKQRKARELIETLPKLPKTSLISTNVVDHLGCSITELNRWARDGRLSPDGKRWSLLGGSYHRWLRAWRPATIEAAVSQIEEWREQDKTRKRFARRGLRVQDCRR